MLSLSTRVRWLWKTISHLQLHTDSIDKISSDKNHLIHKDVWQLVVTNEHLVNMKIVSIFAIYQDDPKDYNNESEAIPIDVIKIGNPHKPDDTVLLGEYSSMSQIWMAIKSHKKWQNITKIYYGPKSLPISSDKVKEVINASHAWLQKTTTALWAIAWLCMALFTEQSNWDQQCSNANFE
ncbi:hypothetical protein DdX_08174 [Ditylenchus destructor]|uniref:Uncharacterized protein n=1 Tax=Ditylenchus destructor TaxID=166010 RepID=A0AAD4N812_9BILA|nr:hypothetical protein DdX_08174 [Ditylenchus destructor]